ncbi:hypothetical protein SNEBB_006004 [Seison nebaliae]|nr:hypothetical protein SNEBB_006004 [Seison nebaliae]
MTSDSDYALPTNLSEVKFQDSDSVTFESDGTSTVRKYVDTRVRRRLLKACIGETLGVFIVMFVGIGAGSIPPLSINNSRGGGNVICVSFAFGITITCMVYLLLDLSGGHLNPIMTISIFILRNIDRLTAIAFFVSQLGGSILACVTLRAILPHSRVTMVLRLGKFHDEFSDVSQVQAIIMEFILAFALVLVTLAAIDLNRTNALFMTPIFIGFINIACHLFALPYTGCGLGPARALGPAVAMLDFTNQWIYWVGPISGSICGSLIYEVLYRESAPSVPPPKPGKSASIKASGKASAQTGNKLKKIMGKSKKK